ncbi:hypothetical protein [Bacillus taeanensis]|uniref:Uncharacterized protein n=1 Tax=Bacillus taeanensis TaxID=273032 RepID=A0A366Y145_9BACI|nr:hypothetical protein [Bacillus taeanensis]RBW70729.1 hypothetical protein DS031_04390 [Bacillus taeanensis]
MKKREYYPVEILLWSIALPGFGQFLNGNLIKGLTFVFLEFLVNVNSNLNLNIKHSFQGQFEEAVAVTNYQWALFYPCLYIFAMFDAYMDALKLAEQNSPSFISIPFVTAAYFSTIGVIFSDYSVFYRFLAPTFIPITAMIIGFIIGGWIRKWLVHKAYTKT